MSPTSPGAAMPKASQKTAAYERRGVAIAGQGEPVVLLHGSMSSKAQWNTLAQQLAGRFRVVAFDLQGYGDNRAAIGLQSFSIDDEVDFLVARLDDVIGARAAHVVGHSYGGLVAMRLAQRFPERVSSLVLYEPMALSLLAGDSVAAPAHEAGLAITALVNKHCQYEAAQVCIDFWSEPGAFAALPLPVKARLAAGAPQTALNYQAEVSCPLTLEDLRSIWAPTLLLGGARSPACMQRIVRILAETLPNSRMNWLITNHTGPVSAAALVNPWIKSFLEINAA